jgi:hypothetical protein
MISLIETYRRAKPRRKSAVVVLGGNRGVRGSRPGRTGMPVLALALAVLPVARAIAGVEYVTRPLIVPITWSAWARS